jgi:DNA-binding helix-hairpin-helix protein with protein kinase domain
MAQARNPYEGVPQLSMGPSTLEDAIAKGVVFSGPTNLSTQCTANVLP